MPSRSIPASRRLSARVSGVPRIIISPATAAATEMKKMARQPNWAETTPPKIEHSPDPPQEPIDQMLIARWRAAPCQYVLISARLDGMMHAADSPCSARPASSAGAASVPAGASATSSDPAMLRQKPSCRIR